MGFERHVKVGDRVKIHFTGKLDDGSIFDSSIDKDPLIFKVGNGDIIQGIDEAIVGMKLGQEKVLHVTSDKAYGAIERELIISIEKEKLPGDLEIQIDQELQIPNDDGNPINVRITNITDHTIELDGNHPLAGKNLIFDLKLIEIMS